jgi:DNA-binding NarL/FixJ family response regulator
MLGKTGRHVPAAPADPPAMPQQLKTYIVEDSPLIRDNLVAALEELVPVEVVGTADDEATAVNWLARAEIECDLVIIDIFLKRGSGLNVLKAAPPRNAQRKLVVLTNYATADIRHRCLALGADRVFDKSNEIDAFFSYCHRLASGEAQASSHGQLC